MRNVILEIDGRNVLINGNTQEVIRQFFNSPKELGNGIFLNYLPKDNNAQGLRVLNNVGAVVRDQSKAYFNPVFFYAWAVFLSKTSESDLNASEQFKQVIEASNMLVYSDGLNLFKDYGFLSPEFIEGVNLAYLGVRTRNGEQVSTNEVDSIMKVMTPLLESEIAQRRISFELN